MSSSNLELIERNLDDFYIKCTNHPNFKSKISKRLSWISSTKADWPDCIYHVDFEGLNTTREINRIKTLILKKKLPNAWTIGPLSKPNNLRQSVKLIFPQEYHQSGMILNLNNIVENDNELNYEVLLVKDENLLKDWVRIVSSVFCLKVDSELINYLFHETEVKFFLTNYKGKNVAALLLFLSSEVVGLHAVSTLDEFRSKGLALEMSRTALIYAQQLGYQKASLQASSMGEKIYTKLGFQKYCDIYSYGLEI